MNVFSHLSVHQSVGVAFQLRADSLHAGHGAKGDGAEVWFLRQCCGDHDVAGKLARAQERARGARGIGNRLDGGFTIGVEDRTGCRIFDYKSNRVTDGDPALPFTA